MFEAKHLLGGEWRRALAEPDQVTREWLATQKVRTVEIQSPAGRAGQIKVVVRIESDQEESFLRLSGIESVITTNFITDDADKEKYRVIELPGKSRAEAVEQARLLGAHAFGACPKGAGWGVRVLKAKLVEMSK